jgi:glycine betaine/proline transport system substrate-binding protein
MFKMNWKPIALITSLAFALLVAGCGTNNSDSNDEAADTPLVGEGQEIELTLVNWESEIASTNVIAKVLEDLGYDVTITPVDMSIMWESVVNGEADGMVAAWLPGDMKAQYEEYGDDVVDLGPNLEKAKIGLVVPSYMDINSIEDLDDQGDKVIIGIDPGAGVVTAAEDAIEDYNNLNDWEVQVSSDGAMVTALGQAYENEEPIIVTGWSPHWKFSSYDLKFLEDPQGSFGDEQYISTMVRKGLEKDMPEAYKVLDEFYWTAEDMEEVMLDMSEGTDPEKAASKWIENNQDKVDEWIEGIK